MSGLLRGVRVRHPHIASCCPVGGCATCCPPSPHRPAMPATTHARSRPRQPHRRYRPADPELAKTTNRLQRLDLRRETHVALPTARGSDARAHDQLRHGMACARCRNHYWTGGRVGDTCLT